MLIGRLDGRLRHSPARDVWLARARVSAAAAVAGIAGVPVYADDILNWVCGRTLPPRHSEGLNDPLSVAALFHYMLIAQEDDIDPVARSTLTALRTILDDRDAAETWGRDDLVRFGSAFRQGQVALTAPYPAPTLQAVAERLLEVHGSLDVAPIGGRTLSTLDGRQLTIEPQGFGSVWLLACLLPGALAAAGLTTAIIPSFVSLPRYLTSPIPDLASVMEHMLGKTSLEGLAELDRLETRVKSIAVDLAVTKRSRLPELLRLDIAYPGLRVPAVARLLGVSPQGAAKLVAQVREAKGGARSGLMR